MHSISELVSLQIQTVAKTARVHRNMWVENADRWVAGFLEMFEEGCHKMVSSIFRDCNLSDPIGSTLCVILCLHVFLNLQASVSQGTAIRDRIQESLRGQPVRGLLENGDDSDDEDEYYYDSEEEYYDDEYSDSGSGEK